MDSPCETGVEILVSITPTASLCRFIPNASKKLITLQQTRMLGMLRRLGILGPIVWAAYWGDIELADCERLWVLEGELAELYAYLNAGIASESGMPELESPSFGKLASDPPSVEATRQESPFTHSDDHRNVTPSRKKKQKKKRPSIASGGDNRAVVAPRPEDERKHGSARQRRRGTDRNVDRRVIVAKNRITTAAGLCELFDNEKIPLPKKLSEAASWAKAYHTPIHRHAVEQAIHRARKTGEQPKH
jgi:hypothetical protein